MIEESKSMASLPKTSWIACTNSSKKTNEYGTEAKLLENMQRD